MRTRRGRVVVPLALVLASASFASGLLPTDAAPQGTLLIRGADSGSHLVVSASGGAIFVSGYMAPGRPQGCRLTAGRNGADCSLEGVAAIEIEMGPNGDLVEIADPLPVPLVAHLGGGSDKLVANGEADVCYSEGARRNRC